MSSLLKIEFDAERSEQIYREELRKVLAKQESRKGFWDIKELERQTCMSKSAILERFFYDERFAKIRFKIGQKWYFPANETEEFLLMWLREQK